MQLCNLEESIKQTVVGSEPYQTEIMMSYRTITLNDLIQRDSLFDGAQIKDVHRYFRNKVNDASLYIKGIGRKHSSSHRTLNHKLYRAIYNVEAYSNAIKLLEAYLLEENNP